MFHDSSVALLSPETCFNASWFQVLRQVSPHSVLTTVESQEMPRYICVPGSPVGNFEICQMELIFIVYGENLQWMVALRHLVSKVSEEKRKEKSEEQAVTAPLLLPTN